MGDQVKNHRLSEAELHEMFNLTTVPTMVKIKKHREISTRQLTARGLEIQWGRNAAGHGSTPHTERASVAHVPGPFFLD